eukprot:TRINITY_DN13373_c0_g2_i1.p1 TRINITY_DN13373_c0_g2~~TRINITY_DN13373_c0_g2_i1.p1  ORF type:complete len:1335 (+),score=241.66 TRINITY_DN13373_c0_g2_i1:3-4007(+)
MNSSPSRHGTISSEWPVGLVHEGWLVKRSRSLHIWRHRWVSLWDGQGSNPPSLCFAPRVKDYVSLSESFALARIRNVRVVEDSFFNRPCCFVVEYCEKLKTDGASIRFIGMQAPTEESRDMWILEVSRRMWSGSGGNDSAPVLTGLPSALVTARSEATQSSDELPHPQLSSRCSSSDSSRGPQRWPNSARGTPATPQEVNNLVDANQLSPTDAPATKHKGKGAGSKGKCQKGPPPPKAASKGKGKGLTSGEASKPKALPFGKRMNLKDSGALPLTARGDRQETIFQGLLSKREGRTQEDIDMLQVMFSTSATSGGSQSSRSRSATPPLAGTPRTVLPDRVARNCAIVMRRLPLRGRDLVDAVERLEPGPLDADHIERFANVIPEPKLMAELAQAGNSEDPPLRDVEKVLLPFAHLGRLPQRLKALMFAAALQPQELQFMEQMQWMQTASCQLRHSVILKQVLATVLVMFNYVNFGRVLRSEARAFDIKSLLRLSEFKAAKGPFPAFNALHYVAKRLLADDAIISAKSLAEELSAVSSASGVCLVSINRYVEELQAETVKLQEEKIANAKVYGGKHLPPKLVLPKPTWTSSEDIFLFAPRGSGPSKGGEAMQTTEAAVGTNPKQAVEQDALVPSRPAGVWSLVAWMRRQTVQSRPPKTIFALVKSTPRFAPKPDCLLLSCPGMGISALKVAISVSAPGLICYCKSSESGTAEGEVCCVPLVGAQVSPLEEKASSPPRFEISVPASPGKDGFGVRMILEAENLRRAWRWHQAVQKCAQDPSVGWLQIPNNFHVMCWRWVVLQHVPDSLADGNPCQDARWLVWYMTPEDLLLGEPPRGGCKLSQLTEVFISDDRSFEFWLNGVSSKTCDDDASHKLKLRARNITEMRSWTQMLRGVMHSNLNDQDSEPTPRVFAEASHASQAAISSNTDMKIPTIKVPSLVLSQIADSSSPSSARKARPSAQAARVNDGESRAASVKTCEVVQENPKNRWPPPLAPHASADEFQKCTITPREALNATPRIDEVSDESGTSTEDSADNVSDSSCDTRSTVSSPVAPPVKPRPSLEAIAPLLLPLPSSSPTTPAAGSRPEDIGSSLTPDKLSPSPNLEPAQEISLGEDVENTTYGRMTQLAEEAELSGARLSAMLRSTLEEGRALVRFLGQELGSTESSRDDPELPRHIQAAFQTMDKFINLLRSAIADVQKFEGSASKRSDSSGDTDLSSNQVESFGFVRRRSKNSVHDNSDPQEREHIQIRLLARDAVFRTVAKACESGVTVHPPILESLRGGSLQRGISCSSDSISSSRSSQSTLNSGRSSLTSARSSLGAGSRLKPAMRRVGLPN